MNKQNKKADSVDNISTQIHENGNAVNTILSQSSIASIESFLRNFWDNTEHDCFTDKMMSMLAVYVKHCPDDAHTFKQPDWMINFVSELIQMNQWLCNIANDERVWEWEDTCEGWRLKN